MIGSDEHIYAAARRTRSVPVSLSTSQSVRVDPERKTGVKHAEVVTTRLVQDERGWLRLAG